MNDRTIYRLQDIMDAIDQIDGLLEGKTFEDAQADRVLRAAFERFLEILSEASRHIPDELKQLEPDVPWRRIGDIGNHLRHAYQRVDAEILWNLYAGGSLARLRSVVAEFLVIWAERERRL
ncbi:MAG TPA: HepT-like ribonuclease domain-containing protein [Rhizobiaceae bacterium]